MQQFAEGYVKDTSMEVQPLRQTRLVLIREAARGLGDMRFCV